MKAGGEIQVQRPSGVEFGVEVEELRILWKIGTGDLVPQESVVIPNSERYRKL